MDLKIPKHLAIIVDGNGRWAKEKGKIRSLGHKAGYERLEKTILYAEKKGIEVISLYVFSTENFKRDKDEVDYLMDLFTNNFKKLLSKYKEKNIKVVFSGRREPLEQRVLDAMDEITEKTKDHDGMIVNFCLNYGSHAEIIDACKQISQKVQNNEIDIEDINENLFQKHLYHELPPVDFLIRTSGEQRVSNFLLWQISYAEFYFSPVYFPDFIEEEFDHALEVYTSRDRRFGGVKK